MTIFNTMTRIEKIYDECEGNLTKVMTNYEISDDDFDYLINLKEHYNTK